MGEGEDERQLRARAAALGIADAVFFIGVTNEIADYYQAMDVFVFPSLYEGLGMALLEAQVTGLWCVANEALPMEVVIDPSAVCRLSLGAGARNWALSALTGVNVGRQDRSLAAKVKGYDIEDSVARVANWYEGLH